MSAQAQKPATIVVHDHSIVGECTVEAMRSKGLAVRETTWSELELSNALGILTIPPTSGESIREVVRRARTVLEAATAQEARVVQCHHAGALGRPESDQPLDAEARTKADSVAYFHREYVREMELYRYLEHGLHVVPVVIGFCVRGDGASDWGLREGLRDWSEYLRLGPHRLDVSRVESVAAGLVSVLQQARPGRRYILGGSSAEAGDLARSLGVEMCGPISTDRFKRGIGLVGRFAASASERLSSQIEPFLYGAVLDSTRARGELGYMPRAPILA